MTAENATVIKNRTDEILNRLPKTIKTMWYMHTSEQMPELSEGSVDLVVTSPPYPMVEMWDELGSYEEQHHMIKEVMLECYEKLRDGGIMCINIGDATRTKAGRFRCYPNHSRVTENAEDIGFCPLIPVMWKKPQNSPNKFMGSGMKPTNAYVTNEMEYILIFRKGNKRKFEDSLMREVSQYTQKQRNEWFSQVWEVGGESQDGYASFPFEIPYRLIRMFSVVGDTVLDPFVGTGTTLKAAKSLGRHSVGYEVDKELDSKIQESVSEVESIGWEDVLRNHIRVDRDNAEPETFYKNPPTLVDFL